MAVTSVLIFFLVVYLAKAAIFDVNYFENSQMENMNCDVARLVVYRMNLRTFWSEEKFPKSYPKFRPPAQWSTVFGEHKSVKLLLVEETCFLCTVCHLNLKRIYLNYNFTKKVLKKLNMLYIIPRCATFSSFSQRFGHHV